MMTTMFLITDVLKAFELYSQTFPSDSYVAWQYYFQDKLLPAKARQTFCQQPSFYREE